MTTDRIIAESSLADFDTALAELKKTQPSGPEITGLEEERQRLAEQLSTGDWGRIGVLAGLLWYKLDVMIKLLGDNNQELKNIGNAIKR